MNNIQAMKSDRRATALPRKTSAIRLLRTDVSMRRPLIAKPLPRLERKRLRKRMTACGDGFASLEAL